MKKWETPELNQLGINLTKDETKTCFCEEGQAQAASSEEISPLWWWPGWPGHPHKPGNPCPPKPTPNPNPTPNPTPDQNLSPELPLS
ncbi:Uncharacterised protein [Turicibacter sanguinis]|nr:Uncharacterised protein [Turicibacter sanguinis]